MAKAEKKNLTDPIADYLWDRTTIPEHLWHYTDARGLIGIATEQSLWCSEYRHLNDSEEISTFATSIQAHLQHELERHLSNADAASAIESSSLYTTWNVFICSFCADADRNEHWHQYARKAGYALGFAPHILRTLAKKQGFTLGRVIYGEDLARNIAIAVLKDKLSVLQSLKSPLSVIEMREVSNYLCRLILSYAPFFKPASFERENEWRLVKVTGLSGDGAIRFRANTAFGLLGYYDFKFKIDDRGKLRRTGSVPKGLIPRVITGPGNETNGLTRASHPYELLSQNGLSTLVSESTSSLRFLG